MAAGKQSKGNNAFWSRGFVVILLGPVFSERNTPATQQRLWGLSCAGRSSLGSFRRRGADAGSMMGKELSSHRVRILSGKTAGEVDTGCEKATCTQ